MSSTHYHSSLTLSTHFCSSPSLPNNPNRSPKTGVLSTSTHNLVNNMQESSQPKKELVKLQVDTKPKLPQLVDLPNVREKI